VVLFDNFNSQVVLLNNNLSFFTITFNNISLKVICCWSGIRDADLVCVLIDGTERFGDKLKIIFDEIIKKEMRAIVVINKVDIVKKPKLLDLTHQITTYFPNYN